jgi:hypothetical protein
MWIASVTHRTLDALPEPPPIPYGTYRQGNWAELQLNSNGTYQLNTGFVERGTYSVSGGSITFTDGATRDPKRVPYRYSSQLQALYIYYYENVPPTTYIKQ